MKFNWKNLLNDIAVVAIPIAFRAMTDHLATTSSGPGESLPPTTKGRTYVTSQRKVRTTVTKIPGSNDPR